MYLVEEGLDDCEGNEERCDAYVYKSADVLTSVDSF